VLKSNVFKISARCQQDEKRVKNKIK